MNPDQIGGLVRNLLIPLGAFMAAHGIAAGTWDGITGFVIAGAAFAWAGFTHEETQDLLLSVVRGAIGAIGGYMVQRGWVAADQVTLYIGVAAMIVPNIWTWFANRFPDLVASSKKASVAMLALLLSPVALKVAVAIAVSIGIAACAGVANFAASADKTLAQVASNDLPTACGVVSVAEGYYAAIKAKQSAANQAAEAKAELAANAICSNPPTSVSAALIKLGTIWMQIQANTTVPAS